jgi:hypothetical protein
MLKALIYITLLILFFAIVIRQIAKFVLLKFYSEKPKEKLNPYIEYHKMKMVNDDNYEEYLEWTKNKEVYGTPLEKVEAPDEKEASVKVRQLIPRRKFTDDDKLF